MIVHLQQAAIRDLEQIGDCPSLDMALDNPQRALSFVRELRAACLELGELAWAFPLVPRYAEQGVRCRVSGNYLILYRIAEQAERVDVLRVVHGVRDWVGSVL
ncbi:MAG: type II toxin-antitoxin system RelE/ParE family toxin [Alcanivoracaceae bacterium]